MTFGKKIQDLRKDKHMSQGDVGEKIGTSGTIIGRYERDEITPSVEVAKNLAAVFGVSIDYLVDETGSLAPFKDMEMMKRWELLQKLPATDKEHILFAIDAMIRDSITRNTIFPAR